MLGRSHWGADALRDLVRDCAVETPASFEAVLVIDETGFLKQGKASCGVGRQYTGSAGKITNCQVGVLAAYMSDKGHAFIDRQRYLPEGLDQLTGAAGGRPCTGRDGVRPSAACGGRFCEDGPAKGRWVAADSIQGVGEIEMALRRADKGYVLGVTGQHAFWSWGSSAPIAGTAGEIAQALDPSAWVRLSAGAGTKGPRLHDWAYLELATLAADALDPALDESPWTRGLLMRRSLADASLALFTTWCPAGTPVETLVAVEGRRWAIEDAFETAKTELGLAHNETRSTAPLSTARLAPPRLAGDAGLRPAGRGPSPGRRHAPKKPGAPAIALVRWSLQEIRRVAARLAQRRIKPALVIAWSAWRRAHQARARQAHLKRGLQL